MGQSQEVMPDAQLGEERKRGPNGPGLEQDRTEALEALTRAFKAFGQLLSTLVGRKRKKPWL